MFLLFQLIILRISAHGNYITKYLLNCDLEGLLNCSYFVLLLTSGLPSVACAAAFLVPFKKIRGIKDTYKESAATTNLKGINYASNEDINQFVQITEVL